MHTSTTAVRVTLLPESAAQSRGADVRTASVSSVSNVRVDTALLSTVHVAFVSVTLFPAVTSSLTSHCVLVPN